MPDQLSLFGGSGVAEAAPTDRLFFGIFPPGNVATRITKAGEAAQARDGLRAALLPEDRFHVTLIHIGDYVGLPRDAVAKAEAAAGDVIAHPFEVRFDRIASFRNGPLVMLGGEDDLAALMAFRRALAHAVARVGLKTKSSLTQFKPHVTLLYDRNTIVAEQPVEPIGWTARELVLIHSLLGKTVHIPLGRWPFAG